MALAALVLLLAARPAQPVSLYRKYFPAASITNAFAYYLQSADIASNDRLRELIDFVNLRQSYDSQGLARQTGVPKLTAPAPLKPSSTALEARREIMRQFGRAVDLVQEGNKWTPTSFREKMDYETKLDELSPYRVVGRVMDAGATVAFADGNSGRATDILLAELTFGRQIGNDTLIHYLVGVAIDGTALTRFERSFPRLSIRDCKSIEFTCVGLLARPDPITSAMQGEARGVAASAKQILEPGALGVGERQTDLAQFVANLNDGDRRKATDQIVRRVVEQCEEVIAILKGPESEWLKLDNPPQPDPNQKIQSLDDLVEQASAMVMPVYRQVAAAGIRIRTQIRLLRLHALVELFRLENDRLPDTLSESCSIEDMKDPAFGGEYRYEPLGKGAYRLYSKGNSTTGEIELGSRPKVAEAPAEGIPPNDRVAER